MIEEEEKASQIVFHCIFGTYKGNLSVLEQKVNVKRWYTREEMGNCFRQQRSRTGKTKFYLPQATYSKMFYANQLRLLLGVYNQVTNDNGGFCGKHRH